MTGATLVVLFAAIAQGRHPAPASRVRSFATISPQASSFTVNVTPASISFNATNPDSVPVVAGNASASVTWQALSGGNNWNLKVQASSPSFANCPAVPVSAVRVSCSSASVGSLGGSAACSGSFPLSTAAQQVAGGAEGVVAYNYSVTITFTLADSWKYIAETNPACSLTLTYTADVP